MDADGFTIVRGSGRRPRKHDAQSREKGNGPARGFRYAQRGVPRGVEELCPYKLHSLVTTAAIALEASTYWAGVREALAGEISGQWHDGIGWRWHRAANDIGAPAMAKQSSGINPLTEQSSEATPLAARPITPTALAVHDLVCYGIGSLIDSRDAREQMAFAVSVAEWLKIPGSVYVYEPVLTPVELDAVERLGCTPIRHNEEAKRVADAPTLFYMPRCGALLYNNLLWANWGPLLGNNVAILGNSFTAYAIRHPASKLAAAVPYIHKVLPHVHETPLPDRPLDSAFASTVLLTFPAVQSLPADVWHDRPEPPPLVDGLEI